MDPLVNQARARAGDSRPTETEAETSPGERLEDLYHQHSGLVRQLVRSRLGWSTQDAEDIEQEVWLAALKGLPKFRHESQPKTWLKRIAINATLMWVRRESYRQHVSLADWIIASPVLPNEERLDLDTALGILPRLQRTVLLWHDAYGLPHATIARRLRVARCTSIRLLATARQRAKWQLSPHQRSP